MAVYNHRLDSAAGFGLYNNARDFPHAISSHQWTFEARGAWIQAPPGGCVPFLGSAGYVSWSKW